MRRMLAGALPALLSFALVLALGPPAAGRTASAPSRGGDAGIRDALADRPPDRARPVARSANGSRPAAERARRSSRHRLTELAGDPRASRGDALAAVRASLLELAGLDRFLPEDEEEEEEWSSVFADPAGDLDGDGGEDLLEYEYRESFDGTDWQEELWVSGVKGTTGETMWKLDGGDFEIAVPAGDLDGQPGVDLLTMAIEVHPPTVMNRWDITYGAIRGSDGAEIWSRTFVNEWREVGIPGGGLYIDRDFALLEALVGDVDGDGSSDLLIGRHDITAVEAAVVSQVDWTIRFEALSGGDGQSVFSTTREVSSWEEEVWGAGIGDVTGDGSGDVGIVAVDWGSYPTTGSLSAYGGKTSAEAWTRSFSAPDLWWVDVWSMALDGGSHGDVLLTLEGGDWDSDFTDVIAVSGASGAAMWERTIPGYGLLQSAGDADGDGGTEILIRAWEYTYDENDEETETAHLGLLHGGTGAELWWRTEAASEGQETVVGWGIAGDATGDGVLDVVLSRYQRGDCYEEEEDGWVWTWCDYFPTGDRELLSGRDTSVVWGRPAAEHQWLFGLGDLDGDGAGDLIEMVDEQQADGTWISRYGAVSGPAGSDLWPDVVTADGFVWWLDAAALLGGPGMDLLEGLEREPGDETVARTGADGSLLWRRPA